jgi:dTDP-4-amino-4,6-dideoxygalactose transaminase
MLEVTKTYLPDKNKFLQYIDGIWDNHVLTNGGPNLLEFENRLKLHSGIADVLACTNGTIVLQLALKALGITKEVITTPFTYVATTNAILWEHCTPIFADINPDDLTIDVNTIEKLITPDTQAILATHVYGRPCDVIAIEKLAQKYNLKVIYDAANAFGTSYKDKSIFAYGDISTCSFHATKLFHSGEGGALYINDPQYTAQLSLYRAFGHIHDDYFTEGINAKMSEFHAALGLCVLDDLPSIIAQRKLISQHYDSLIDRSVRFLQPVNPDIIYNYAYYPVLLRDEAQLNRAMTALIAAGIRPRRYFYPSLNTLPFIKECNSCPVSESISTRVMCLPLSHYVTQGEVETIASIINQQILQS